MAPYFWDLGYQNGTLLLGTLHSEVTMNDCDRPVVEQVRPYVVAGRALREAGYNVLLCGPGRRRA